MRLKINDIHEILEQHDVEFDYVVDAMSEKTRKFNYKEMNDRLDRIVEVVVEDEGDGDIAFILDKIEHVRRIMKDDTVAYFLCIDISDRYMRQLFTEYAVKQGFLQLEDDSFCVWGNSAGTACINAKKGDAFYD